MSDEKKEAMDCKTNLSQYAQDLAGVQQRLFSYILMLMGDPVQASDVLQETNLLLWEKSDLFEAGTNFAAWSRSVAFNQVRKYRLSRKRNRLVFDDRVLAKVTGVIEQLEADQTDQQVALSLCLEDVPVRQRELLDKRYRQGQSVIAMGAEFKRSASSISVSLSRIRAKLMDCIEGKINRGEI